VTRDELELVLRREGLTQPQTTAALQAADAYATTQAANAINALAWHTRPVLRHLLDLRNKTFTACGAGGVNTTRRADVTCERCKTALKAAS